MSNWSKSFLMTAFFLTVVSFQNCGPSSRVSFTDSASKASNQDTTPQTDGDGQPFDGKVYVNLGDVCPDQTNIQSKILLKTFTTATLVREKCRDITPIALGTNDFQLNPANSDQLTYQSQLFISVKPTQIVGAKVNMSAVAAELGFAYLVSQNFGTTADTTGSTTVSKLLLYEDGIALGPAHALHSDIRNLGRGRYSHWDTTYGADPLAGETLRFSASDNTDPRTNGRVYTYKIAP